MSGQRGSGREETPEERTDRNLEELLGELRVILPGVQVLFAFLLVVPFNQRFADVSTFQKYLYLGTLLCAAVASACLIAPSIHHRISFRRQDKEHLVMRANRLTIVGSVFLAVAMTGAIWLIAGYLFGDLITAIAAGAVAVLFIVVWYAVPLLAPAAALAFGSSGRDRHTHGGGTSPGPLACSSCGAGRWGLQGLPAAAPALHDAQGAGTAPVHARVPTRCLQALDDVSFEVKRGRVLRHRGPQRVAARAPCSSASPGSTASTPGQIAVAGRLSPFIELGVGFNPELTARDNVFINAIMLGLTRTRPSERFDEIIAFAELEEFVDLKLKNYSSGMSVRLGFSVAVQVDADVLLVDEVLAVGDAVVPAQVLRRVRRACAARARRSSS